MNILEYMKTDDIASQLDEKDSSQLAAELRKVIDLELYPSSIAVANNTLFFLGRRNGEKHLGVVSSNSRLHRNFPGETSTVNLGDEPATLTIAQTSSQNAAALREVFPFLKPQLLGLKKSAGCGDRLGLGTPGHIRAIRHSTMAPIFPQQSIRENARTGRTPQEVIDDAMWGIFQEGWREPFGADADHLKTPDDIDSCVSAGFTFYTIDPGEHVDNEANTAPVDLLRKKVDALPWTNLETTWQATRDSLENRAIDLGDFNIRLEEEELLRAAAKYGKVVAHTVMMYRHLEQRMNGNPFELEMSVDETDTVTTLAEHIYIAHELKRLGVKWVSLAPRYVGTFEKGVDYIGDLAEFERSFAAHLAVAKTFGPYKLSLHSGSDKFSVYPIAGRLAGNLVHLKTAGTSYLEALRTIAQSNPALFRRIVAFAKERYPIDRASYHVSAEVTKVADADRLPDSALTSLLEDFDAREVLHVTFGSVLNNPDFREPFFATLRDDEEAYYKMLEIHFNKHFAPFDQAAALGTEK
jgi:hypothetical protein